jgi:hypothetical protein
LTKPFFTTVELSPLLPLLHLLSNLLKILCFF